MFQGMVGLIAVVMQDRDGQPCIGMTNREGCRGANIAACSQRTALEPIPFSVGAPGMFIATSM